MSVLYMVIISMFAALGVTLIALEFLRSFRAKKTSYVCVCFREELLGDAKPDMLIICRTETEEEEIIRRLCVGEDRKVFIKRW